MNGPVTIGDLKREARLLEIGCLGCGWHLYVDPAGVKLCRTTCRCRRRLPGSSARYYQGWDYSDGSAPG